MSPTIAEFLTHGILPFTGRADEVERIVHFWRETLHSARLRGMLITGEAGIGKSALMEAAISAIQAEGGTVIHLRLYPESTASIAPLLSRALWLSPGSRGLLRSEPERSLQSSITALRRVVRLRPTLLVIDNLKLLSGAPLAELRSIIEAFSDEPLAIAGTSGVGDGTAHAVFAQILSDEIELKGLTVPEVAELCASLLEGPVSQEILEMVVEATAGNPLAIRAAIRGALTSGMIRRQESTQVWESRVPDQLLRNQLATDVQMLSIGMSLHLTDAERAAARALARLGEIFSREAAEMILPEVAHTLAMLQEKGILTQGSLGTIPLPGSISATAPLAFSHTLLHRSLLDDNEADATQLLDVIVADVPLYSILPFRVIIERPLREPTPETIDGVVMRAIDISYRLDGTPDWHLSLELCASCDLLLDLHEARLDQRRARHLRLEILRVRGYMLSRSKQSRSYADASRRLRELTVDPVDEEDARHRVFALVLDMDCGSRTDFIREVDHEAAEEVEALLKRFPSLRHTNEYLYYLVDLGRIGVMIDAPDMLRHASKLLDELLAEPDLPEGFRRLALNRVSVQLLPYFEDRKELQDRLRLLEMLESTEKIPSNRFLRQKASFLKDIMRYEESLALMERILPETADMGIKRIYDQWVIARLEMLVAFGANYETTEQKIMEIVASTPEQGRPQVARYATGALVWIALRRGDLSGAVRAIEAFIPAADRNFSQQIIMAMVTGQTDGIDGEVDDSDLTTLRPLVRMIMGKDVDMTEVAEGVRTVIGRDPLRTEDMIYCLLILEVLEHFAPRDPRFAALREELGGDLTRSLQRRLERLAENKQFAYVASMAEKWGRYLPPREVKRWKARAAELAAAWREAHPQPDEQKVCVTMFGRIEISRGSEQPKATRGARLRTILGLMVANQILDDPLSLQEFCAIAEGDADPERAKNNLHVGIHRLREALGHDAILTEQRIPQFNPEIVKVDLLDAHRLLADSNEALRQGHLIRAWSSLREALEITRGEVPYPTLYNNFFEAARQDFELYLRATTIAVARAFLLEEDAPSAAQVLRLAIASMPGDDEISELLSDALVRSGRRADAHRMKMRNTSDEVIN